MPENQRRHPRKALAYDAMLFSADGTRVGPCRVIDISQRGARIAIDPATELPDWLLLAFTRRGSVKRRCVQTWRRDWNVGLRFETEDGA